MTVPGEYTVTASSPAGGCGAIETITVLEDKEEPIIDFSASSTSLFCGEENLIIDASLSSQGSAFEYNWTPAANILTGANSLNPEVNESGTYSLTITNTLNGCSATADIEITEEGLPKITSFDLGEISCFGVSDGIIEITETEGGAPVYSYSLNGLPFTENTRFENLAAGNYTIQVIDANDCTSEIELVLEEPDPLQVELSGDSITKPNQVVQLQATVSPPDADLIDISWQPNEQDKDLDVNILINQETLFSITVTDVNGCKASDALLVRLENSIYFPNIINPYSRNDNNIFTGYGRENGSVIRTLKVFDRWGGLMFVGQNMAPGDTSVGWDGTYRGKAVNKGIYTFFAVVEFSDGEVVQVSGDVMVIR